LRARYPGLRRYLPAFFALPFQGEPGSDQLLAGLTLVRQLDAGMLKALPQLSTPPEPPALELGRASGTVYLVYLPGVRVGLFFGRK
jgi:hypothetical protein